MLLLVFLGKGGHIAYCLLLTYKHGVAAPRFLSAHICLPAKCLYFSESDMGKLGAATSCL